MKIRLALAFLTIATAVGAAQDRMVDSLRKGVVEEESKHDLNAAIEDYQAALSQFAEARQTAATALFRMAECYRKQGKDDRAMAAYQRVAREFADQGNLAEQSRSSLTGAYHQAAAEAPSNNPHDQALKAYRDTLVEEVSMIKNELQAVQRRVGSGLVPPEELDRVKIKLVQAERQLAAFDAGIYPHQEIPAPTKK
jgi:tetratricopeptide (TPR) repeat protein